MELQENSIIIDDEAAIACLDEAKPLIIGHHEDPECPFAHSNSGIASCSFSSETRGEDPGSTEFVTIMSTYILLLVVPAQSSPGYGSEMNCPLKTMPALSSPTRIIKNKSPRRASSHSQMLQFIRIVEIERLTIAFGTIIAYIIILSLNTKR